MTSTDYLRERLAARGDEIEAITGHFPLCTTELLDGRYTTVTLLREPVERTLSYLRHHRKEEPADRDKSLEEIYEDPFRFKSFVHNHMTKMLSLTPAEMTDGMLTPMELDESHLERAKEALEGIDAVGLQERFDEFFGRLEDRFGWRLGEPETLNTTDPVDVSQSFRERIAADNALDVELYEFAQELVASRSDRKSFEVAEPETTEPDADAPAISVIIPTYNRASLLERSLESLTGQTLPRDEFEVIVVDDGSSDWTQTVCTKLSDRLPLRYFRIENSGISAAKNLGVFAAHAPLLLFFDDDDIADPGLLEAHVETHREHPDEQVAVLGYTTWDPELEVTPIMEHVTEIGQHLFSYKNLEDGQRLDYTYFWGGRSSCKRALLTTHGSFDQDMSGIEDMELGFRLARQGLSVIHTRDAKSYMVRAVTFDQFAERCQKRGRALWRFTQRHRGSRGRALLPGGGGPREVAIAGAAAGGQGRARPRARTSPHGEWRAGGGGVGGAARALRLDAGGVPVTRRGRSGGGGLRRDTARRYVLARLVPCVGDLPGADLHHRVAEVGHQHPGLVARGTQRALDRGRIGHLLLPAQGRVPGERLRDVGRPHGRLLAAQPGSGSRGRSSPISDWA